MSEADTIREGDDEMKPHSRRRLPTPLPQVYEPDDMLTFIAMGCCVEYPTCPDDSHYFCKMALPAENAWAALERRAEQEVIRAEHAERERDEWRQGKARAMGKLEQAEAERDEERAFLESIAELAAKLGRAGISKVIATHIAATTPGEPTP